ncbi:alpha/beta hydrolase [Microvirga terrae]|uniref:Alpha/beta hydrolase n=1 Tax=Microvirga terrae TaxID=2740529 RepID=A0ABY5RXG3_9HYPH|nr:MULTISPECIES: alpha/beta hydrolase [Microvirga]MBQ0819621.1 alpha/beta hydrolase [Microvirga sp. HBU67558]UVF21948.1 alpha/beta hydrolase [Microvirga terrae]
MTGVRRAYPRALASCARHLVALAVALGLSGCASNKGALLPVAATVPGASTVDMLVATTRMRASDPQEFYSGGRGPELSFAEFTVSIPPAANRTPGEVQWPQRNPGNPATDFVTLKADVIDRKQATTWFHRTVRTVPQRRVLVFIHGFNNRFDDAVFRFAQIVHDAGTPVVPVLFTWPSRGSILAYGYDRESNTYSRNALETTLRTLASDPAVGEISILAHSMGNWVTLEALRQMAIRDGRVAPKIRNVLLAAPDVDVDLFREAVVDMGRSRPNFTLFVSQDDRALAVSRRLWGDAVRLGAIDPDQEPYRSELETSGITVLNLSKLRTGDPLNHSKFAESPEVVRIIGRELAEGQTLTDSRVGVGDRIIQVTAGAAAAVGTAAGLAVSAPVAVVDPRTRENFQGHVEGLGQAVSGTLTP